MQCGQTRESHRPAAAAVFLLAVTLAATAGPAAAIISPGWAFPLTMTRDELAVVCGSGRDWLDMWMSADLDYVRSDDGIRGEVDYGIDVWLRDSDALAENARVTKSTGPMIRCSSVDIEIYSPTDASRRVVSEKNLAWRSVLEGGDGVITLDRMQYTAVIPGLKVGDRLRLVWHQEWVRGHGMPVVTLRGLAGGPAHAAVRLQVPDSQKLIYALAGATDLADSVSYWGDTTHGSTVGFWEFREAPRHAGQPRNTDDKVLTLVTHVAPAAGGSAVTASFVGAADWEQAARGYRQRIEPLLQPSMEMKALAMELIAGKTTSRERIAALYDHVQSTTRYLGLYTGEGGIIPAAADVTRRLGYGDCKGLSTYLIALCRAVDIPAWPVVLMVDRNRTLAADIPNMGQFNHFIALADDGQGGCWLDPTLEGIPAGVVTAGDAAEPVLVTTPGAEGLRRIPRAAWAPGCRLIHVDGLVDQTMRLQATVTLAATGPGGLVLANYFGRLQDKRRDAALRDYLLPPALRQASTSPVATDSADTLPTWRREVHATSALPGGAGTVFVPSEIAFLPELHDRAEDAAGIADSAARADRRETWRLTMPEGWNLAGPDSFAVAGPGLHWTRSVRQDGNAIVLRRTIDWDDENVPAERCDEAVKALADAIVHERAPLLLSREPVATKQAVGQ